MDSDIIDLERCVYRLNEEFFALVTDREVKLEEVSEEEAETDWNPFVLESSGNSNCIRFMGIQVYPGNYREMEVCFDDEGQDVEDFVRRKACWVAGILGWIHDRWSNEEASRGDSEEDGDFAYEASKVKVKNKKKAKNKKKDV